MQTKGAGVRIGHIAAAGQYRECLHCRKRQVGCHSQCRAYLAFQAKNAARREAGRKIRLEGDDVAAVFENRNRANRRARKKR